MDTYDVFNNEIYTETKFGSKIFCHNGTIKLIHSSDGIFIIS